MLATLSVVFDLLQPGRVYDGVAAVCVDYDVVSRGPIRQGIIHPTFNAYSPRAHVLMSKSSGTRRKTLLAPSSNVLCPFPVVSSRNAMSPVSRCAFVPSEASTSILPETVTAN